MPTSHINHTKQYHTHVLEIPTQIISTSTKTILRVDRYVKQQVNLTDGIIKKNYLNDNAKEEYINNHMTTRNNTVHKKNKGNINILVVNRRMREKGWVYEKILKLMDQDNIDNLCYLTAAGKESLFGVSDGSLRC